jgi:hypothetical protein
MSGKLGGGVAGVGVAACVVIFAAAAGGVNGMALGQPGLTPVDEQFDDVSPLSNSLRVQPLDLRQPIQFDRVYRIDPNLRLFGGGQKFARIDNGIIAVFDRSEYTPAKRGVLRAEIPAGTVFYLGDPTAVLAAHGQEDYGPSILAVNLSAAEQIESPVHRRENIGLIEQSTPTVFSNEAYRVYRIGQLLDMAASRE